MSDKIDRINNKIDKLIERIRMEQQCEELDYKSIANIMRDVEIVVGEKVKYILEEEQDKEERGF